jgi:transposase InsO family protein
VEEYVKGCAKCQESKVGTTLKRAPLHRFDTPVTKGPFQYVSMDLITDLPKSGRYDAILTIVDQGCSKSAKFIPCNKTIDGEGVATLYFKHLFPLFGIPQRIISDRDPRFTSHFSRAVCKATGIQQNLSTAFHPRTDGQTERMNQWIETYLRSFVNGRQNNWSALLPIAEFAHNSWPHEHTKYTPHELITGNVPSAKLIPLDDSTPSAHSRLSDIQKARSDAQETLLLRNKPIKEPRTFHINQKVWLDSRNLKVNVPSKKLAPRRYGPFTIKEKISPVAYRINLPNHMKIHDVFHIDLLTPFHETEIYGEAFPQPPPDLIEGEEEYEVEEIVNDRTIRRKREYLIKWKGYPSSENSWVKAKDLHAPELLKDYHDSKGRKVGTFQYIRRPKIAQKQHQFTLT